MENSLKSSQMISHIKFKFSPNVSHLYSKSLNVEKYMQDRWVNPLSQDAKNTPNTYICINWENIQWQDTAVNQANRSTFLDSEIWTKALSYTNQIVKEVAEI